PTPTPTPGLVTVTAENGATTVTQGTTLQFNAIVSPTSVPQDVIWDIASVSFMPNVSINSSGLLDVGSSVAAGTTITVRATAVNSNVFGTRNVTVTAADDPHAELRAQLTGLISTVQSVVDNTVVSTAANLVPIGTYWVTQQQMDAINSAINTATNALTATTADALNTAMANLITAFNTFDGQQDKGTMTQQRDHLGTYDIVFASPTPTPGPTPNPVAPFIHINHGPYWPIFHLSHTGVEAGSSLDDIPGVWASGGSGSTHTVLEGSRIQVQTGTTGHAGTFNGIDIVPSELAGYFGNGSILPGDIIEVMIGLDSIQPGSGVSRQPVNNGFRIEASPGREVSAPGMQPVANRFGWNPVSHQNDVPLGFLIQPGAAPIILTVIVDSSFIEANHDEWDWVPVAGERQRIGDAEPPRFRIAPHIVTDWDDDDGLDGLGGSTFTIYDILIRREAPVPPPAPMSVEENNIIPMLSAIPFMFNGHIPGVTPGPAIPTNISHDLPGIIYIPTGSTTLPNGAFVEWELVPGEGRLTSSAVNLPISGGTISSTQSGTARVSVTVVTPFVEPTPHAINLVSEGTGHVANPNPATVNTPVILTAGTRNGFTFVNWVSDDVSISNAASTTAATFIMPDKPVTITAVWSANAIQHNITLEDGGDQSSLSHQSAAQGTQIAINAGTREGYRFTHWTANNSSVSFANVNNASTTFNMVNAPVTVTAHWILMTDSHTVTFNAGNAVFKNPNAPGGVVEITVSKDGDSRIGTLPRMHEMTINGFRFGGWRISGTDEFLRDGGIIEDDMAVEAVWIQTPTNFRLGDVYNTGRVTSSGASAIARWLLTDPESRNPNFCQLAADITGSGYVSISDVTMLARWLVGHDIGHLIAN
ncbi:MAG: InlB B-repeat-containing protein, partial [Defluviitaleaceae bacterium]|nr:InlB B-repeat-containing protein [Defluviitaleaceae bacterium]